MDSTTLTVLAIDDDPGDVEILRRYLLDMPVYDVELIHAENISQAHELLTRPDIDLVFLDYRLGAETGQDILQAIRSAGDIRPVIILTGQGDEELAVSVMRSGADDYLAKNTMEPRTLWHAVEHARGQYVRRKMETRNRELLQELQIAKKTLESKNARLADLYDTAHQFVDHVSHEFRTPLTVIKEFATIILDGLAGETNDEQKEFLDVIIKRVDDLSHLVDDMLDTSKLEAGMLGINREDIRPEDIIQRVEKSLLQRAETSHAKLEFDLDPDLPVVYCDPEKAGRVMINLVINALKFCGEPGHVILRVTTEPEEHQVRFSVIDNGPGISQENLDMLFQRFQQVGIQARKGLKGFGLGLSIARELVYLNLGSIDVQSQVGSGSTFSFTIPTAERKPLLSRYLKTTKQLRNDINFVSMLHMKTDCKSRPEIIDDIEALLLNNTRHTDLLFRTSPCSWIVVAASNQVDLENMKKRLYSVYQEARQSRPNTPMPNIDFEQEGPWNIQGQEHIFIDAFIAAEAKKEPAHA